MDPTRYGGECGVGASIVIEANGILINASPNQYLFVRLQAHTLHREVKVCTRCVSFELDLKASAPDANLREDGGRIGQQWIATESIFSEIRQPVAIAIRREADIRPVGAEVLIAPQVSRESVAG